MLSPSDIAATAANLISGDRNATHGDARQNHLNIGALWIAYLERRFPAAGRLHLTAHDVMQMMALLKIARTMAGRHNPDDYVDAVGYLSLAGGEAERIAALASGIKTEEDLR